MYKRLSYAHVGYICLCLLLIFVLGYVFIIKNTVNHYHELTINYIKLKKLFALHQRQSVNIESMRAKIKVTKQQLNKMLVVLLNKSPEVLLDKISSLTRLSGVSLESISPLPNVRGMFYTTKPFSLSVVGTYPQLIILLNQIAHLNYLVVLHDFTLERISTLEEPLLRLNIIAHTYIDESLQRKPILSNTPHAHSYSNPFHTHILTTLESVNNYPLDALHFVGILKNGSTTWGLISKPDGCVFSVMIGDYIGKQHGRITYIHHNEIALETQINGVKQILMPLRRR